MIGKQNIIYYSLGGILIAGIFVLAVNLMCLTDSNGEGQHIETNEPYPHEKRPKPIIIWFHNGVWDSPKALKLGILGFLVFIGWLVSIFTWLISWRRTMTDKVDRMMPGIFISVMLAITVSCVTQESLAPATAMVPWLVHFLVIFGIWISYYRTQMAELNAMWETEYYEDDEQTYDWQPEFQGENYYY